MKTRLFIILSLFSIFIYGQKVKDSLFEIWRNVGLADSTRANAYNKIIMDFYIYNKPDSAYIMGKNLEQFVLSKRIKKMLGDVAITYGNIESAFGNDSKATTNYVKALGLFRKYNDKKGEASALNNLGKSFKSLWDFDKALKYYEQSLDISTSLKDSIQISTNLTNIGNIYANRFKLDKAKSYYDQSIIISNNINDIRGKLIATLNLGLLFLQKKDYTRGLKIINDILKESKAIETEDIEVNALHILMSHHFNLKQYEKSNYYGKKCLELAQSNSNKTMIKNCYNLFYETYKDIGEFKIANKFLEDRILLDVQIDNIKSAQQLQRLEIDRVRMRDSLLQVEKEIKTTLVHEKEIQQKNKEKTNLTLAWGGSLSAVSIFAFLIFRSSKRKQRKAEEERQQQIEEKEKILKDLELSTIDAMIEGQEKERQRLAEDLHDSVGATLSAAKLQFDYLIKNQNDIKYSEELIKKTSTLLEDAYDEVRSMAHLKNSGVIAKNGLLPAVEKLSKNASGINGLTFEIQSFGLEQRLENSLEITIFRIIQELVTNIIKHANATKGIVHLTNHDDNLNIMIEDNGKGFNPKHISKTNAGMGIISIAKRVEHLEGKLTVESEKGEGTTIIIDIPL